MIIKIGDMVREMDDDDTWVNALVLNVQINDDPFIFGYRIKCLVRDKVRTFNCDETYLEKNMITVKSVL